MASSDTVVGSIPKLSFNHDTKVKFDCANFNIDFLPCPDRAQFKSHPVKACKLGSAMEMSSPRLSKIACIKKQLFFCVVPVMKNS